MINIRVKKIYNGMALFMKHRFKYLGILLAIIFTSSISAQNLTPVANDDVLNVFTNSGANTINVQANDVDDSPVLITTIFTPALHGTVLVLLGDSIVYTPDSNYCGLDSFVYEICDNGVPSLCAQATVVITVSPVDTDGDGLNDVFETYLGDVDGDSVVNYLDIDSDNDGISDAIEGQQILSCSPTPPDTDNDGVPDYLDLDSDNDGLTDMLESGNALFDTDDDGLIDNISGTDHNGNGMPDAIEASLDRDFDVDGVPDRLDLDSDNDGLSDALESNNSTFDTNGDGTINGLDASGGDADGDGISDGCDGFVGPGDGVGNQNEIFMDPDGDGRYNTYDLDSDNDGSGDALESDRAALDINADGVIDGTDTDGDGIINVALLDGNITFGGDAGTQLIIGHDNDGDGVIDAQDLDADNDRIADVWENGFAAFDTNNDGVIDGADNDNDGFIDVVLLDSNSTYGAVAGTQSIIGLDPDGDGSINSEDLDDDNDGIADIVELGFGNLDADDDGVMDGTDDDNDGIINNQYVDANLIFGGNLGSQNELSNDVDNDSIYDFFDLDSDSDTIPDVYEGGFGALDTDNDGRVDGTDTDGDGVINVAPIDTNSTYGFSAGTQNQVAMDADGDGHINSEDLDSDADGIPDKTEWDWNNDGTGNDDCDFNTIPNYLDPISCDLEIPNAFSPNGDNINDDFHIQGVNVYPNNKFSVFNRWGVVVFEAAPYTVDWDGTSAVLGGIGGEALPVGTYFYVLDLGDGSAPKSGFIYLNR